MTTDLYRTLGVRKNATPAQIQKAYRKKAMVHHPDRSGSAEAFAAVNLAYKILSDPARRDKYDATGEVDKPEPDNRFTKNVEILMSCFITATEQVLKSGSTPDQENMVIHMRRILSALSNNARGTLSQKTNLMAGLRAAKGRFEIEGEFNVLEHGIRTYLVELQNDVDRVQRDIEQFKSAGELLERFKYRAEVARLPGQRRTSFAEIFGLHNGW
jgi:curved DNA-binding protein CbpA